MIEEIKMTKIIHEQTVLTVDYIESLKQKTGEISTKEAEDMWAKKLERVVQRKKKEE